MNYDNSIRILARITFRLLLETTSDKRSGISSLDSHPWTFTSKQFELISFQKVDLKYLRTLLANKELPFLFKFKFFIPKCYSLMLLLWIKSIFSWLKWIFIRELVPWTVLLISFLSFLVTILKKTTLVFGESFFSCFKIFLTLFSRFSPW